MKKLLFSFISVFSIIASLQAMDKSASPRVSSPGRAQASSPRVQPLSAERMAIKAALERRLSSPGRAQAASPRREREEVKRPLSTDKIAPQALEARLSSPGRTQAASPRREEVKQPLSTGNITPIQALENHLAAPGRTVSPRRREREMLFVATFKKKDVLRSKLGLLPAETPDITGMNDKLFEMFLDAEIGEVASLLLTQQRKERSTITLQPSKENN